jgi:cadherin EGF LAG seven-pass G-type receptor 1
LLLLIKLFVGNKKNVFESAVCGVNMGSVGFYLLVAGLGVLLRTSQSKGFTVHLFDEVASGTVIFNGSLPESGYSYYIEQLDSSLPLSGIAINASSGIVYATSVLRCERTFKFHTKAVRKVHSSFSDIVVVRVTVYVHGQNCFTKYRRKRVANKAFELLPYRFKRNVNNNAPKFQQARYTRRVLEEQEPPLLIDTITAVDPSGGGQITYSLLATKDRRSQLMFTIDAVSGQIATTQKLDREAISVHFLAIIATADRGRSVLTASTQLVITVLDINDHAPLFERTVYVASVSESSSIGESIITIRATDDDAESNGLIEYSLQLNDRDEGTFSINSQTGSISIQRSLDREKKDFYRFFVTASDKALIADRQSSTATVEITVVDENDNRPFFEKSSYIVEVNEDLDYTNRPTLVEVRAIDIDSGVNSLIRYSISSGNELGAFAIDADTGSIALVKPLDFERLSSYQLTVRAQDGGSPPRSNTTVVNIRVIDVNDNDPRFFLPLYQASIVENVPVGSNVLQVQAVDADSGLNGAVVYSFQNIVGYFPFVIGRTNGQIATNGSVDREVQSRYFFRVEARDQGKLARSATVPVEITIRDLNDNSPMFEPDTYYAAASEEYPLGTFVTMVTATDIDEAENGQLTYSISSGNVGNAFSVHKQAEQGTITVARKLNYREQNVYALVIAATDHGGLSGFATVFVNITAANIHAPAFQATPYYVRVNEDLPVGGTVFRVRASDDDVGDNAAVSYSIADGSNTFAINAATGDVTTKLPLDRESKASHVLLVIARDHGLPPKSDTAELEIVLNDVNDNPPVFLQSSYAGRVSEDALIGTSVAAIAASDADQGLNGRVFYTFDGVGAYSGEGDFSVDAVHGTIRVARPLDRERTARYALVALAVDRGEPVPLTASVTITVDVDDVNDNAPQFDMGVLHLYVKENSPVGTCIGQVTAIDPDGGEGHADVEYSMLEAYDYLSFSMVVLPGAPGATVCTQIELDYEGGRKQYVITIRARSLDLFSDASVHIHVQDVNDNVPVLNDFAIVFNNFENHFPTGNIGRVPAFDLDINDTLRYKFVAGNQAHILHLNQTTGLLRLDSRLNSDVPIDATLIVSVSGK